MIYRNTVYGVYECFALREPFAQTSQEPFRMQSIIMASFLGSIFTLNTYFYPQIGPTEVVGSSNFARNAKLRKTRCRKVLCALNIDCHKMNF